MPIDYKLERDGTLVVARATGVLSLESVLFLVKELKADANLRERHDAFFNVKQISDNQITEEDLPVIAQELASGPRKLSATRLALVANEEKTFILGHKYSAVEKESDERVVVFFNDDVARTWLGI